MKTFKLICAIFFAAGMVAALADETTTNAPAPAATGSTNEVAIIKTSEGTMVFEFWPERRAQDGRKF